MEVVVELKNDSEVRGLVEFCDPSMNLTLYQVEQTLATGEIHRYDRMHVQGPKIRYVHIAKHIKTSSLISSHMERLDRTIKRSQPHKIVDRPNKRLACDSIKQDITLETPDYDEEADGGDQEQ